MRIIESLLVTIFALQINIACADTPLDKWMSTTVLIQNEWNNVGTGFFVFKGVKGVDEKNNDVYLVTNKHNINKDKIKRAEARVLNLHLNLEGNDNNIHVEKPNKLMKPTVASRKGSNSSSTSLSISP